MPIRRTQTPKGQTYKPNPKPKEEYTEPVNVARLSRRARKARGL
jgi:hypothetical protein